MNQISCEDIKVTYILKKKELVDGLNGLSITFNSGRVNILMGDNGCGKTTLFNCIVGLLPYDGMIKFDDKDANELSIKDRKISYVQQQLTLFPRLTIFDNLAFPLKNNKLPQEEIIKKIYAILKEFGILHLANCLPRQISIGQFQKVLLAKALIVEPEVIILDEAFSNLDEVTSKFIQQKIKDYTVKNNAITISVYHSIDDAIMFGDYFYVINNHEVLFEGAKTKDIKHKIYRYLKDEEKEESAL